MKTLAKNRLHSSARLSLMALVGLALAGGAEAVRGKSALDGFDPNANGAVRVRLTPERAARDSVRRLRGKHGADLNLAVLHRRRAPHRAGHACRDTIPAITAVVHVATAVSIMPRRHRRDCFCAPDVAVRW